MANNNVKEVWIDPEQDLENKLFVDTNIIIDASKNGRTIPQYALITPKVLEEIQRFIEKNEIPEEVLKSLIVARLPDELKNEFYKYKRKAFSTCLDIRMAPFTEDDNVNKLRLKPNLSGADTELAAYCMLVNGTVYTKDKLLGETIEQLKRQHYADS